MASLSKDSSLVHVPAPEPQPFPGEGSNELQVPESGDSPVSCWVLVISLALIVVICCVAVFWLLRFHEPKKPTTAIFQLPARATDVYPTTSTMNIAVTPRCLLSPPPSFLRRHPSTLPLEHEITEVLEAVVGPQKLLSTKATDEVVVLGCVS